MIAAAQEGAAGSVERTESTSIGAWCRTVVFLDGSNADPAGRKTQCGHYPNAPTSIS
jgi:hypothetical protein